MEFPKCKFCGERHRNGPEWCSALKSSGGGVESRHADVRSKTGGAEATVPSRGESTYKGWQKSPRHPTNRVVPAQISGNQSVAGVAPSPPEAKKKRAPNGTFDRKAYQRELMRKRRAAKK